MKITDGNLFAAMRLVLPEHRALMKQREKEAAKQNFPALAEDEREEMEYILEEALIRGEKVQVTLFAPYGNLILEGIPRMKRDQLYIQTEEGLHKVDTARVIRLEKE